MRVAGIDQSLTSTGFVVLDDGILNHFEIFTSDKKSDVFERIAHIESQITNAIFFHKIDIVRIEGLSFSSFGKSTRDLAALQGVLVHQIHYKLSKPITIVPPTTLKKYATGNGKAKKQEMFDALPMIIKQKFKYLKKTKGLYDITDAYWLSVFD